MMVLRSGVILSAVTSKTAQPLATQNVDLEPVTPAKTFEFLNQSSNNTTPSSSSSDQICRRGLGSGSGSVMVFETGTMRRCSARLARKLGGSEDLENVEVVSGKRRKVERSSFNGEFDVKNLEREALGLKLGVDISCGVPESNNSGHLLQNLGDGGITELVTDVEGVKDSGSVAKMEFGCDIETVEVETMNNGRDKRKFSMEVKSLYLDSHEKDDMDKGFLNLRSGKRVLKREMKDDSSCAGNWFDGIDNSEKSSVVLSGDVLVEATQASMKEDENGRLKGRRFSREEKGKCKVGCETFLMRGSVSRNSGLDDRQGSVLIDSNRDAINSPKDADPKEAVRDKHSMIIETCVKTRRRLSREVKGKMKLEVKDTSSSGTNSVEPKIENVNGSSVSGNAHSAANETLLMITDVTESDSKRYRMEHFRSIARQNASRFAHFSSEDELGSHAPDVGGREIPLPEVDSGIEDWPGPFSTAMKIIKDRETRKNGEQQGASACKSEAGELKWIPKKQESCKHQKQVPSLQELCLSILSKNADAIASLDFVPDVLRHKISWFLCDSRRMDSHFLELLLHGSPTEIRIRDCSWLSEDLFTKSFEGCNTSKLTVLQFDQCGGCMPDYTLFATLAHSPNSLPTLTTISLKGAYRLSDAGLSMLVTSAPSLKSIDISQCPLVTSEGICCLANSLRLVLRELYLDNCQGIDAMLILPALLKLENLEVLSLAGIQTVCDDFVGEFVSVHGCRMKELVLADCMELTDSSLEVIGYTCSELRAIDLTNLYKLTDISIGHLANGCPAIEVLKCGRNAFSDEAIAAYLDVRGAFLKDLSLNNIMQVSNHTALSLSRNCRNLWGLDLSWCRNLTNEALGLIVDSCSFLKVLKLFGCTQVTNVFLDGHSNAQVKLIGLKMTPLLKHIDVPDFLVGPLRYSSISA